MSIKTHTPVEYKTVPFSQLKSQSYSEFDPEKLNEHGRDGWKLVSTGRECVFMRERGQIDV